MQASLMAGCLPIWRSPMPTWMRNPMMRLSPWMAARMPTALQTRTAMPLMTQAEVIRPPMQRRMEACPPSGHRMLISMPVR